MSSTSKDLLMQSNIRSSDAYIIQMMNDTVKERLQFVGLDTHYSVVCDIDSPDSTKTHELQQKQRIHLDGAASPLASGIALDAVQRLLPHYSNTHSVVHSSAQISTQALAWSHKTMLDFVGASSQNYTSIFSGAGTTSAINRVARGLKQARPNRPVVLVSSMEHHANDLPHRHVSNEVHYIPLSGEGRHLGCIDLHAFEALLIEHADRVNYIAVSSVSNVTGIKNPVSRMIELAHEYGAYVLVDGAQSVAHSPTELDILAADFFVFSGHKMYAPMSPGVLIAKKSVLNSMGEQDLGGGSVASVSFYDYELLSHYPDREQSGTPNIVGAFALANVAQTLSAYGMKTVENHENAVMTQLFGSLKQLENVTVYGDLALSRCGALSFNHTLIDHGLLAAILNDYHAIAVRNECFCAHPYVSSLLKEELWELDLSGIPESEQDAYINRKRGMVRASISAYNTPEDVSTLIAAIRHIEHHIDVLAPQYTALPDGSYQHKYVQIDWQQTLGALNGIKGTI